MGALLTGLRVAATVAGIWMLASVVVAVPVAALINVGSRRDRSRRDAERQRAWREANR